jgi:hypothetical protein
MVSIEESIIVEISTLQMGLAYVKTSLSSKTYQEMRAVLETLEA